MRELARSRNYAVAHDYETAYLILSDGLRIPLGYWYGDPACAVIDHQERWCVVAGCGLLVSFLREPFQPAGVLPSSQYAWIKPQLGESWWVEAMVQSADDTVRIAVDPTSTGIGVSELYLPGLEMRLVCSPHATQAIERENPRSRSSTRRTSDR